jgi:hypothetical protein
MRFPSLQSLAGGAWRAFLRFPIAILLAIKATGLGIWWIHLSDSYGRRYVDLSVAPKAPPQWYWNAIISCYLGMLLSVAMTKWIEKRRDRDSAGRGAAGGDRRLAIGLQIAVLVLAGLYYWSLPPDLNGQMVIRTVVLALGLHWLIAVIGFSAREVNGFWIFNKRLFLRALTAWLYSAVLYTGVSLALLAIEKLFNTDIRYEVYEDCWWVLGGLFSVWFFLGGFPKSYENPPVIGDYPRGLKIFTQYVLLSLVTVYLLILYAYMFKIIFTAHWPVGWVAWMVMAFAVAGILSLLLIYPLRNEENNSWIRSYTKFFYLALLPLIVLLFCAIYKRVAPYGITEQRYFLLALAFWLSFITGYFLLSREKDIRLVPLSLCVLAFLSVWGPWGAFAVSLHSQRHRLETLLGEHGLLANGRILTGKTGVKIAAKDRRAISSVTDYLVEEHGYKALQPLFSQNLDSLMRSNRLTGRWQESNQVEAIMKLMNVSYVTRWATVDDTTTNPTLIPYFNCTPESDDTATMTDGMMYLGKFSVGPTDTDWDFVSVGGEKLRITIDNGRGQLKLAWVSGGSEVAVDLGPVVQKLLTQGTQYSMTLPRRDLELSFAGRSIVGKLLLTSLEGNKEDNRVQFRRITGMILFSKK